jgi:pimeloyl-ACP methyl ester carboxylesterase
MSLTPFVLPFSQSALDDLHERLRRTRWPDEISGAPWEYGFDLGSLQGICRHWLERFDWKRQLERLSEFAHYRFESQGTGIHFVYERGKGPAPLPLILTHGWPGSFVEFLSVIRRLTDPAAHGGDPADAFDVVVPSLPGFGYSDRPSARGMHAFRVAELWADLMSELGYRRFGAQGGDLGAGVSTALGLRHPDRLIGVHLNFIPSSYGPYLEGRTALTAAEQEFVGGAARWAEENGAYAQVHRTRPQTLAYGVTDSPAGLAAWILEKFREWSDCGGDLGQVAPLDELLTNVTVYWMTGAVHSSFRLYFENRKAPFQFGPDDFVGTPCAITHFPKEILFPPRAWVERGYNVQKWTEMPRGGHFAALEQPDLLARDIRMFFRRFRS